MSGRSSFVNGFWLMQWLTVIFILGESVDYLSVHCSSLVTCGRDNEIVPFVRDTEDLERVNDFDITANYVTAMICYRTQKGSEVVAVATDNNTVQAFSMDVSG